jgi:hypothetical protein
MWGGDTYSVGSLYRTNLIFVKIKDKFLRSRSLGRQCPILLIIEHGELMNMSRFLLIKVIHICKFPLLNNQQNRVLSTPSSDSKKFILNLSKYVFTDSEEAVFRKGLNFSITNPDSDLDTSWHLNPSERRTSQIPPISLCVPICVLPGKGSVKALPRQRRHQQWKNCSKRRFLCGTCRIKGN